MGIKLFGQEFEYPNSWPAVTGLTGVCLAVTLPTCLWAMSNPNQARDVLIRVIGQVQTNQETSIEMSMVMATNMEAHATAIRLLKAELDYLATELRKIDTSGGTSKPRAGTNNTPSPITNLLQYSALVARPLTSAEWSAQTNQMRDLGKSINERLVRQKGALDALRYSLPSKLP